MSNPCKRDGCRRYGRAGDDFCSTYCARRHNGVLVDSGYQKEEPSPQLTKKNRRRKYLDKTTVAFKVDELDAMDKRLPGSFGSGKRR